MSFGIIAAMYKKAYRYDDDLIVYFDAFDNKWIARGNSLAWRTNNPGLLHSSDFKPNHSHGVIGNSHKVAIFSSARAGIEALRIWLSTQPRQQALLPIIAKCLQPDHIEECLERLCQLTSLAPDTDRGQLSIVSFNRLLIAIKKMSGYSEGAQQSFVLVPKIKARFLSKDLSVEFYLSSEDDCLSKDAAIASVLSHRLDAVVVHKADGTVYLRSRPGHHRNQIKFSEADLSSPAAFEDALRDVGTYEEGQCIWAFINGIWNRNSGAAETVMTISKETGGERVWSLINNFCLFGNSSILLSAVQKLNIDTQIVRFAAQFFRLLITLSDRAPSRPPIIVFLHSQGALIGNLALERLSESERQRLRLFTFGGASFIPPGKSHNESHNYISIKDRVPQAVENLTLMALRLYQSRKAGYTLAQILEQLIEEDIALYLDLTDPDDIRAFSDKRKTFHEKIIEKVANVTVLDQTSSWICEHLMDIPCYNNKIREIINHYQRVRVFK